MEKAFIVDFMDNYLEIICNDREYAKCVVFSRAKNGDIVILLHRRCGDEILNKVQEALTNYFRERGAIIKQAGKHYDKVLWYDLMEILDVDSGNIIRVMVI